MTQDENRTFMKDFFERYYAKQLREHSLVPPDAEVWKLIPSTVTEEDIQQWENAHHIRLPECVRAFHSMYHHQFEQPIGENTEGDAFDSLEKAYNPHVAENGYLPLAWDRAGIYLRCIDLSNMPDEEKCPVMEIDHEPFFDLQFDANQQNRLIPREQLVPLMHPVAENFYEYLNLIYEDKIP